MEKHTCKATVYPREQYGSFHGHACGKTASVEHEGNWYCKIHDPEAEARRSREAEGRYKAKIEKEHVDRVLQAAFLLNIDKNLSILSKEILKSIRDKIDAELVERGYFGKEG